MPSERYLHIIDLVKARQARAPKGPFPVEVLRKGMLATTTNLPLPEGVTTEAVEAGGVPAEWVMADGCDPGRAILYFHGGGYCIGSIETHRNIAAFVSRASQARVLLVDYRLAPEDPFPAAVDDAVAAYRWLTGAAGYEPARVAIAGDSAGGGLTAVTLVALRDA